MDTSTVSTEIKTKSVAIIGLKPYLRLYKFKHIAETKPESKAPYIPATVFPGLISGANLVTPHFFPEK